MGPGTFFGPCHPIRSTAPSSSSQRGANSRTRARCPDVRIFDRAGPNPLTSGTDTAATAGACGPPEPHECGARKGNLARGGGLEHAPGPSEVVRVKLLQPKSEWPSRGERRVGRSVTSRCETDSSADRSEEGGPFSHSAAQRDPQVEERLPRRERPVPSRLSGRSQGSSQKPGNPALLRYRRRLCTVVVVREPPRGGATPPPAQILRRRNAPIVHDLPSRHDT